jgi:hypothetical protein
MVNCLHRLTSTAAIAISMLVFATAGEARTAKPIPSDFPTDEHLDCATLAIEFEDVRWKAFGLYLEVDKSTRGNVAFLALAVLDLTSLAGLQTTDAATEELISYRQRYDRLVTLHEARRCADDIERFPTAKDMKISLEADKKIDDATRLEKIRAYGGKWIGEGRPIAPGNPTSTKEACPPWNFKIRVRNQFVSGFATDGKGRRIGVEGTVRMNGKLWEAVIGTAPLYGSLWRGIYRMQYCTGQYQWRKLQ